MRTIVLTATVALLAAGSIAAASFAGGKAPAGGTALYPDLRTVVPTHLNLVNQQQREWLRFSNGIANTGGGPWALRPEHELGSTPTTTAWQEIRTNHSLYNCAEPRPKQATSCYDVVEEYPVSTFEYHETHNHWHTADVALFQVRKGSATGPVMDGQSQKYGFCLLDLYKLDDNAPTGEKVFWDCYTSYQGISAGWVDQYHQSTDGQQVEITNLPDAGDYFLVSTTNPTGAFKEQSQSNNTAWVQFALTHDSNGNRKVTVKSSSPCEGALCGTRTANR